MTKRKFTAFAVTDQHELKDVLSEHEIRMTWSQLVLIFSTENDV